MTEKDDPRPRVAAIVTTYYPRSHADVIVSKLLGDYTHPAPYDRERFDFHQWARRLAEAPLPVDGQGRLCAPRVRVVSLYTDQVPENDLSRGWSARSGVPIFPTVREALTLGGDRLAVDGVLIVGEHGDYPHNERGQHLYPRRRLFEEAVEVFRASDRAAPVFVDKHLGYAWADASWMVETARELGFPLMAGSSVPTTPVSWRRPRLQLPLGATVHRALVAAHPPFEAYGFHALEALQCVLERRAGGETGVANVQALVGEAMWRAADEGRWPADLLDAALAVSERRTPGDPRQLAREPAVFLLEYRDGLHAAVCLLGGVTSQRAFAADATPPGGSGSQRFAFRFGEGGGEPYAHFAWQVERIQDTICSGQAVQPVERTLLTTGVLDRVMESRWRGGERLETPELAIRYGVTRGAADGGDGA